MSTPIEDFIISLGFDTKAVKSQIDKLHKDLEKFAVNVDAKRVKSAVNSETKIADAKVKGAKDASKEILKVEKDHNRKSEQLDKQHLKRMQAIRQLTMKDANPQLKAMGSYYRKLQSDQSDIGNKSDRVRRRTSLAKFRNTQGFRDLAGDFGESGRASAAGFLRRAREAINSGSKLKMDDVRAEMLKYVRDLRATNKVVTANIRESKAPTQSFIKNQVAAMQTTGAFGGLTPQQRMALQQSAAQQSTRAGATSYLNTGARLGKYAGLQQNKVNINAVIQSGNLNAMKQAVTQLSAINAEMGRMQRRAISAATAMNGLQDSTRNMVREYASLYAIFAGTGAIKEQAKALDGMNAGMVAVSANAEEASHNIKFLTQEALKNGLSIKDASKDYVKLKASIGDKLGLKETEEMFQSLTKAGVVFQLSQDDMSGTIRAISQIENYRSAA